jgi:hypothetical protein
MSRVFGSIAQRATVIYIGSVAALAAFAFLADEARERERLPWDATVSTLLGRLPGAGGDGDVVAQSGALVALVAMIFVPLALLMQGRNRAAAFWTVGVGGLALLNPLVTFALSRPPGASAEGAESLIAGREIILPTATALALIVLGEGRSRRAPAAIVATIFAVVYGLSLVYAHWYDLSGVLAGWCIALAWMTGSWLLFFANTPTADSAVHAQRWPAASLRESALAARVRGFLTRRLLDDLFDWIRFRVDTFPRRVGWLRWLPLPDIQSATYQDIPWIGLSAGRRREATHTRWNRMLPLVTACRVNSAVDVGGNIGWFAFAFARLGIPCVNVERYARNVRIGLYARKRAAISDASFLVMDLTPDRVRMLPSADCFLVLSVWHHLVRDHGPLGATTMLEAMWQKTGRLMFFETGEAEMPATWGLPEMVPDARSWLASYLTATCAPGRVIHLGTHEALGPNNKPCARNLFAVVRPNDVMC